MHFLSGAPHMLTIRKKIRIACVAALLAPALALVAQAPDAIPLSSEPHHHLVLRNSLVNVYDAKAAPGDSLLLHRHDRDAVAIAVGDQTVTVGIPGKPDVHQKNPDGQVRLQRSGYVHSTHVDGDTAYFTVAVELLDPQSGGHNVCATVLAGQPMNCTDAATINPPGARDEDLLYESDQTVVKAVRIPRHHNMKMGNQADPQLIVTLDPLSAPPASGTGPDEALHPGDFVWFDKDGPARTFKNAGDKDARFIELTFKSSAPATSNR